MRYRLPLQIILVALLIMPIAAACQSNSDDLPERIATPSTATIPANDTATEAPVSDEQPTEPATTIPTSPGTAKATATSSPTEVARDLCDIEDLAEGTGAAAPVSYSRPVPPPARLYDSWIALDGITALSWASYWIVQVQIAAECSKADDFGYPEYVVKVERTFRGPVRDYLKVSGLGDRFGSIPFPVVGDELVLFISDPAAPGNNGMNWVTGGPQGTLYIENGLAGAEYSPIRLTLNDFGLAVAVALSGEPPESLPIPAVSLQDSPTGPDLPSTDGRYPAGCGGVLQQGAYSGRETINLLWTSQQVVTGRVIEQLPSFQLQEPSHETDVLLRPVVTDYLVQIEDPIRGLPAEFVRIRRIGGEVNGCLVTNQEGQLLEVGERALFFLSTPESEIEDPTYYLNGGGDGFWRFEQDDTLLVRDANDYRSATIVPARAFANGLRVALGGPPVEHEGYGPEPVTLDDAPAGLPVDWPPFAPDSTLTWTTYQHPTSGLQFDYPEGWSIFIDPESGTLSLANYPTVGGDWESIPDGGVRLDFTQHNQPGFVSATPFIIGPDAYPGSIGFISGITGDTYHVYISYDYGGQTWEVASYFKEPIDLENPNIQPYFAIVMSIIHR